MEAVVASQRCGPFKCILNASYSSTNYAWGSNDIQLYVTNVMLIPRLLVEEEVLVSQEWCPTSNKVIHPVEVV